MDLVSQHYQNEFLFHSAMNLFFEVLKEIESLIETHNLDSVKDEFLNLKNRLLNEIKKVKNG